MAMKPTRPVEPQADVGALLEGMSFTGFQGRRLGESVEAWTSMIEDPDCTILLGLSGAMIPAGMQNCLIELVKRERQEKASTIIERLFIDVYRFGANEKWRDDATALIVKRIT